MKHFKKAVSIFLFSIFALSITAPPSVQGCDRKTHIGCGVGGDIIVFDIVD